MMLNYRCILNCMIMVFISLLGSGAVRDNFNWQFQKRFRFNKMESNLIKEAGNMNVNLSSVNSPSKKYDAVNTAFKGDLKDLKPEKVWNKFEEITKIYRES